MYDMFDEAIAQELGVSKEKYIEKIESCSIELCDKIINLVFTGIPENIIKAKELFDNI